MNAPQELIFAPHSVDAERSVLGALLIDNNALERMGELDEDSFFSYAHRLIYRAIRKQAALSQSWDVITVAETLDAAKKLDEVGGLAYIGSVSSNTPSAANIKRYADIVREHYMRRQIMAAAAELTELAAGKGDVLVADRKSVV